jgi:uroporphyrinogen-III synthase
VSTTARPRVVVTRDESVDDGLSRGLADRGVEPVSLQTVATVPPEDPAALAAAIGALSTYDWIVFTSARAVDAVCTHSNWDAVRPPKVAAVGARTAARLAAYGVPVDVVPALAGADDLVAALRAAARDLAGSRVLWPRSAIALPAVADALSASGATVDSAIAYRTVTVRPAGIEGFISDLEARRVAAVAFLSPSSARGLAGSLPGGDLRALHARTLVASIGPSTSAALCALGAAPDVEPAVRSADALADAICVALAAARSLST